MDRAARDALPSSNACADCSTPLREDQEWCLECGAARTLIHRPPDWRVAAVVIAVVVGLVLLVFAVALINLSSNADHVATQTSAKAATGATHLSTTATAAPSSAGSTTLASWPVGLSGWTVELARSRSQSEANAAATRFAASGLHVGVLDSSRHPSMKPGYWIVFSGRYPGRAGAVTAAAAVQARVSTANAVARRVAPPGGL